MNAERNTYPTDMDNELYGMYDEALSGNEYSQILLGFCYRYGYGVPKSEEDSRCWFNTAKYDSMKCDLFHYNIDPNGASINVYIQYLGINKHLYHLRGFYCMGNKISGQVMMNAATMSNREGKKCFILLKDKITDEILYKKLYESLVEL